MLNMMSQGEVEGLRDGVFTGETTRAVIPQLETHATICRNTV